MITNFPESISTSILNNFTFGDAEARDDALLKNCHIQTSAINELIQDNKDIVLGHRGTGKSAIVRLFEEGVFSFKKEQNQKSIIIVFDEEFNYRSIKSHLTENAFKNQDQELICRAVWEIIILYRAMLKANEEIREADSTLKSHIKDIEALLGLSTKKVSLFDIFLSHKKKVGIKFDSFNPHIIDAYIGLEPTSDTNANNEVAVLKIGEFRKYLNKLLNEKSLIIYILFDRLDDFVIHEEYDVQKLLLQELLSTQRTYREKCTNIKIKTFLRTDLFERLDLNQFGADKIFARCINLSWKSSDIKRFIAQRISHNLLREIPMQRIDFKIDNDRFYIHRDQIPLLS